MKQIQTMKIELINEHYQTIPEAFKKEEILKVSNLKGYSMLYSYRKSNINNPWEIYGKESWQNDADIDKKLDKILSIDEDVWVIELEDKNEEFFRLKGEV